MEYRHQPDARTLHEIDQTLAFIRQHSPQLQESWGQTKWTSGHRVFCLPGRDTEVYVHMVGALKSGKVTWHLMPLYGVAELKDRWGEVLAPFVSGKSCIQFSQFSDLPEPALIDIVSRGSEMFADVLNALAARRRKR